MAIYGQSIKWTDRSGSIATVTVDGRESSEEAFKDCLKDAVYFGWTPVKWWQWWRRNDTKLKEV